MKIKIIACMPILLLAYLLVPVEHRLGSHTASQADGPYVLYSGDTVSVNYIFQKDTLKSVKKEFFTLNQKKQINLTILTDEPGKVFHVKLKEHLEEEGSQYSRVEKMFIVSDIEGNFKAFRKLLQANGVMDENFQWKFGNGHLVLTGDFVDRGAQQNEVLWLIYSLEDQAKSSGGHVHYILGNHEIMNLSGDLRYLNKKYLEHAGLLNNHFPVLLGEQSELGRWLRTKNVIEKVGPILFCHGGISSAVNRMDLPVPRINKLVRPYYADSTYAYELPQTDTLYSDLGPFWYRGYYAGTPKASMQQVDSTLAMYRVKMVATGHTVVADTISILFNGKIVNTDVHHAGGHTEALLVEGKKMYRVSSLGEKFPVSGN